MSDGTIPFNILAFSALTTSCIFLAKIGLKYQFKLKLPLFGALLSDKIHVTLDKDDKRDILGAAIFFGMACIFFLIGFFVGQ